MNLKKYSKEKLLDFQQRMFRIRRFEEEIVELYKSGKMVGLAHLYIGEEAIAVGVCAALGSEDKIGSTHRGHGHMLARGAEMNRMMSEMLGKETGYNKGHGGSMHIMDRSLGILGANGIVGGGIPIATGAAMAMKYMKTKNVAVSFIGDSATNEGTFHESLNMAAIWNLPCVYVVENNLYGMYTDIRDTCKTTDIAVRAKAYDIPGVIVDGNDVIAVYEAAVEAVNRARDGKGPTLIECKTYRHTGHHVADPGLYRCRRNPNEKEEWVERCPIKKMKEELLKSKAVEEEEIINIENEVTEELTKAIKFAEESEYPNPTDAYLHVFSD